MSPSADHIPEDRDDDILAAEYVVGVLEPEERARCVRRLETNPAFADAVRAWQRRLSDFDEFYDPAAPPDDMFSRIEARLFPDTPAATGGRGLWNSLALWRAAAGGLLVLLVVAVVLLADLYPGAVDNRLVAALGADGSPMRYAALYAPETGALSLSRAAGAPPEGRDLELWFLDGSGKPVSLGVLSGTNTARITVQPAHRTLVGAETMLAISVEPPGGSRTGSPTGPVVASGPLRNL